MDVSKNEVIKNNEIATNSAKLQDVHESIGCCCGNTWKMIAVVILFAIFWILTRRLV
ncbi:MAG: hypothetical protein O8C66_02235 [Candidatus Methanoperedens sp.]|nr:hypothetical protein [Candidatus Methanoperedens sp.]MCZ7369305.1 hypothetical protein [Candidatus Methanoperedens sp.]